MIRRKLHFFIAFLFAVLFFEAAQAQTPVLTVSGDRFLLNNQPFDMWGVRVASASQTEDFTQELIDNLDKYKSYGINTITVFYQGSSGGNYDPFTPDGKGFRDIGYRDRMDRIIEECASRQMVVIVGIFYQLKVQGAVPSLNDWEASKTAVKTVSKHLKNKNYQNIILNIANEQNGNEYDSKPWKYVKEVDSLINMVEIADAIWPDMIVGCGGYKHANNEKFAASPSVEVLLFDTNGPQDAEELLNDRFLPEMGGAVKPAVNVEQFGGWTKRFHPPAGNYDASSGRDKHIRDIEQAERVDGLYTFLHSNPWFQGRSVKGGVTRFDLGGAGTSSDPGVRWYFEEVKQAIGGGSLPNLVFTSPLNNASIPSGADLSVSVAASDEDGIAQVELLLDDVSVGIDVEAPYNWASTLPALQGLADGVYKLRAVATDVLGNTSAETITVIIGELKLEVTFESPDEFVTYPVGSNLSVVVNTVTSPNPVDNMRLFINDDFVRQENSAPWEWEKSNKLKNLPSGTYTLRVLATDEAGETDEEQIVVTVGEGDNPIDPNDFPDISFTNPVEGAVLSVGSNIEVEVNASDEDGIAQVELFVNNDFIGTDTEAPYSWVSTSSSALQNLTEGTYMLRAIAIDGLGFSSADTIFITVGSGTGLEVVFDSPNAGATYEEGDDLTVVAQVVSSISDVDYMRLSINNTFVRQENKAPWEWGAAGQNDPLLQNLLAGTYTLRIEATDELGNTDIAEMDITVGDASNQNDLPNITFVAPANNSTIASDTDFTVEVSASDQDGIAQVELFINDALVGTDTEDPYIWESAVASNLQNLPDGTYILKAVAADQLGASNTETITITIASSNSTPFEIAFDSPSENVVYPVGEDIMVVAKVVTNTGSADFMKLFFNGQFVRQENSAPWEWGAPSQNDPLLQNLAAGSYTLRIEATDIDGNLSVKEQTLTVGPDNIPDPDPTSLSGIYRIRLGSSSTSNPKFMDSASSQDVVLKAANQDSDQEWEVSQLPNGEYNIDNKEAGRGVIAILNGSEIGWVAAQALQTDVDKSWRIEAAPTQGGYYIWASGSTSNYLGEANGKVALLSGEPTVWYFDSVINANEKSASDIQNDAGDALSLSIFPNPAQKVVFLEGVSAETSVVVYDLNGQMMIKSKGSILDVQSVSAGLYIIKVSNDQKQLIGRLVIE